MSSGAALLLLLLLPAGIQSFLVNTKFTFISNTKPSRVARISIEEDSRSPSSPSSSTSANFYDWKHGWKIYYETQGTKGPPILLVSGFGVGTFHFSRNIGPLADDGHRVWSIDLLGQGKSWPTREPEHEHNLVLSTDLWQEQVITFIKEVIKEPVYLAGKVQLIDYGKPISLIEDLPLVPFSTPIYIKSGNSLGGFLSTGVAATHPEWVKGVCLLNSTPFWAFLPNRKKMSEMIKAIIPWDGRLPAPDPLYKIGAFYFDKLRDKNTISTMLEAVYANKEAFDEELIEHIQAPTQHPFGHSVFTSILFSPKGEHTFEEYLEKTKAPLLLLYGQKDPWITPVWGKKVKKQKQNALYFELSNVGHCPNHEAPQAVNSLLSKWIACQETGGGEEEMNELLALDRQVFEEEITRSRVEVTLQDSRPRDLMESLGAWLLGWH